MLDYLLNVCVGISTGVGALVSAVPRLQPHILALCLTLLAIIVLVNLRGVRETGLLWTLPTCIFVLSLLTVIVIGLFRTFAAHGHPQPIDHLTRAPQTLPTATFWLLLRAFAAGCTALTGVEAVSNGVPAFCDPTVTTARRTLTLVIITLTILLLGSAFLIRAYGITATQPDSPTYQSVLSMLAAAVLGRGWFYDITIASILAVLSLSANTSFADFPRLCRAMAVDGYLPSSFAIRGRRLAYSVGILVLGLFSAVILIVFRGITDRLIPLFAIGAFLAFTMSQTAMVAHWRRTGGRHADTSAGVPGRLAGWGVSAAINGLGALVTGLTVLFVFVAKFREGAWITAIVLGIVLFTLSAIHRHLERTEALIRVDEIRLDPLPRLPTMLVPVSRWNHATVAAVQFACALSDDVRVLHLAEFPDAGEALCRQWQSDLNFAARDAGIAPPRVIPLPSSYRSLADPIMGYVARVELETPGRKVAVVIPEIVAARWYEHIMHNYRTLLLKLRLFLEGNRRVVIVDMPWQLPRE
jgi:amino acid transporter